LYAPRQRFSPGPGLKILFLTDFDPLTSATSGLKRVAVIANHRSKQGYLPVLRKGQNTKKSGFSEMAAVPENHELLPRGSLLHCHP
jgi:hypothetical protein